MTLDLSFMDRANCRGVDPGLFFPGRGEPTDAARSVCGACEVVDDCLAYALHTGERFGIWGGLSERERRRIRSGAATVEEVRRNSGPCSIPGCDRNARRRGWCNTHYMRWLRTGTVGTATPRRATAEPAKSEPPPPPPLPEHGTRERYAAGCACPPCLKAMLADLKERMRAS